MGGSVAFRASIKVPIADAAAQNFLGGIKQVLHPVKVHQHPVTKLPQSGPANILIRLSAKVLQDFFKLLFLHDDPPLFVRYATHSVQAHAKLPKGMLGMWVTGFW